MQCQNTRNYLVGIYGVAPEILTTRKEMESNEIPGNNVLGLVAGRHDVGSDTQGWGGDRLCDEQIGYKQAMRTKSIFAA